MKRILTFAAGMALLTAPAWAAPQDPGTCCACVADFVAHTSGPAPPPGEEAFFCGLLANDAARDAFKQRCLAVEGTGVCIAMEHAQTQAAGPSLNCPALLEAEAGIICPGGKTVPAAGHGWLVALAGTLAAIGAWFVRRAAAPRA